MNASKCVRLCSRLCFLLIAIVTIFCIAAPARADLLAYYNFDDFGDTTTLSDISGNGNDGDITSYQDAFGVGGSALPVYTADGGGASGVAGDYALDFGPSLNGAVVNLPTAADGAFDSMIDNDTFSIALWIFGAADQPSNDITFSFSHDQTVFADNPRQAQVHIPWSNNQVYWDLSGCCNPDQRINAEIQPDQFQGQWNHYVFLKDEGRSAIYINGDLFLEGSGIKQGHPIVSAQIGGGYPEEADGRSYGGLIDDFAVWDEAIGDDLILDLAGGAHPGIPEPFTLNGTGETYLQDFDSLGTGARRAPKGWVGEDKDGIGSRIDSLGLVDGPLEGAVVSAAGIVNVGGNPERFSSPADGRLGTWQDDLDNSGLLDEGDVIVDAATDRALGNGRVDDDEPGSLAFSIEIAGGPVRAMTLEWDLEVWGGDPEAAFRGAEGGGYIADLSVGGTSYYSETVSLAPGDLFDSSFDQSPNATHDPTLINGNEHSVRGNSSGIVEISSADGAVGNTVDLTFDANHGGADGGWIAAVDNIVLRALAAGDAQADGDVDPADLIQLLAGGAFGQGNIDATWGQGDFDNDGDFDGTDILAVVQGLAGEFPKSYAHDPSNGVPDVLINPATGNITLDTNGTTIGSIVMDSAAGIFNGPNSPDWDAPGDFAADIDTQISMPISFTNPGYTGVDDLGDGIIGDLAPGFDILADLTIKYLDPNGDLLDAEAHVVPEPSSIVLATFAVFGMLGFLWRRRRLS